MVVRRGSDDSRRSQRQSAEHRRRGGSSGQVVGVGGVGFARLAGRLNGSCSTLSKKHADATFGSFRQSS